MSTTNFLRLILLAAIWGSSFLFLRIAVPAVGPVLLIASRVGLAAIFLFAVCLALRKPLDLKTNWKQYLILGLITSALPFLLFAIAARTLPASLLSILNATSPIWGALIAAIWMRTPISGKTICGLLLGVAGVAVIVGFDSVILQPGAWAAVLTALGASLCYGIATNYTRHAKQLDAYAGAHGTMWAATLLFVPALPFFPAPVVPSVAVMLAVVALGVLCSGVATILYFRLILEVGAASTLTVTFLIPVFGILWGHLFLGEAIGWQTVFGSVIVLVGTAMVTGFSPRAALGKNKLSA